MDMDAIAKASRKFRAAVEDNFSSLGLASESFPRGNCGEMSWMLGAYLHDQGLGAFEYICGERGLAIEGTWSSHAWLCSDGIIVDITADQFDDVDDPVIVTEASKWHEQFSTESYGTVSRESLKDSLERPYNKLMEALEARPYG
jgi:hypothetical protein